jgi:hypothetical protein
MIIFLSRLFLISYKFQTFHYSGHFLLTNLLLDLLKKSDSSRIVNLSSMGHYGKEIFKFIFEIYICMLLFKKKRWHY